MKTSHSLILCLPFLFAGCGKEPAMAPAKTLDDYIGQYGKPVLSADTIELKDEHLVIVNPTILGEGPIDAKGKTLLLSKFPVVEQDMKMLKSAPFMSALSMDYQVDYLSGEAVIVQVDKDGKPSEPRTEAVKSVAMKTESQAGDGVKQKE